MTTIVFTPPTINGGQWTDNTMWSGGAYPNSPTANVYIAEIPGTQSPIFPEVIMAPSGQNISVGSLSIAQQDVIVSSGLTVANGLIIDDKGLVQAGTLTAGSLLINSGGSFGASGDVTISGAIVNHGSISGNSTDALSITSGAFINTGTVTADRAVVTITATQAGSSLNLSGTTLTGGTYAVSDGGTLDLKLGGPLVTDAATLSFSNDADGSNTLASFDPTTNAYVSVQNSLTTIADTGSLAVNSASYITSNSLKVDGEILLQQTAKITLGGLTIDAGGTLTAGAMVASAGTATLTAPTVINNGSIDVTNGGDGGASALIINGDVSGSGSIVLSAGTTMPLPHATAIYGASVELNGNFSSNIRFTDGTGTVILDKPQQFTGTLDFAGSGDKIQLDGLSLSSMTSSSYSGDSDGGTLSLTFGSTSYSLKVLGSHTADDFSFSAGVQPFPYSPASLIISEAPVIAGTPMTVMAAEQATLTSPVAIYDTQAAVTGNLDQLQSIAAAGHLSSITLSDQVLPLISLSTAQLAGDAAALAAISSPYQLNIQDATAAQAVQLMSQANIEYITITDTAANVTATLGGLETLITAGAQLTVFLSDAGSAALTVTEAQYRANPAVFAALTVSGTTAYAIDITGVSASDAFEMAGHSYVNTLSITDTAADVAANLDALQALALTGHLSNITLTDGGTPEIDITAAQAASDALALQKIGGAYSVNTGAAAAATVSAGVALGEFQSGSLSAPVTISDSGTHLSSDLDQLLPLVASGKVSSIQVTDTTLAVTPAQLANDAAVLAKVGGIATIVVDGSGANLSVNGVGSLGTMVAFDHQTADYTIASAGDGTGFTVTDIGTGRTSIDSFSNIQGLQFSDHTLIVAATPNTNGVVNSGNITDLYAAVFAREPDLPGLAYYETMMKTSPALPITTYAQGFLQSPEYINNAAHNYAQTSAGDGQFVSDTYTNLLHRGPEAGAVAWYQANVINPILGSATPGTATYTQAELAAHAAVLADFSASAEFTVDVQVTAQHPADGQHWLVLV